MSNPFFSIYTQLRNAFLSLGLRDRKAVIILLALAVPLIMWFGIWNPLETARTGNENAYAKASENYEWMQAHAEAARKQVTQAAPNPARTNGSWMSVITTLAQSEDISINHAEEAKGKVHISIGRADFNRLLNFLEALQRDHGIETSQIGISRIVGQTGFVGAEIFFQSNSQP